LLTIFFCIIKNPIKRFNIPLNLNKWFDKRIIENKRNEIKNIVLNLSKQQIENPLKSKYTDENDKPNGTSNNNNKKQKLETQLTDTLLDVIQSTQSQTNLTTLNQCKDNSKINPQSSLSSKIINDMVKL
jgi:hypothetical protein